MRLAGSGPEGAPSDVVRDGIAAEFNLARLEGAGGPMLPLGGGGCSSPAEGDEGRCARGTANNDEGRILGNLRPLSTLGTRLDRGLSTADAEDGGEAARSTAEPPPPPPSDDAADDIAAGPLPNEEKLNGRLANPPLNVSPSPFSAACATTLPPCTSIQLRPSERAFSQVDAVAAAPDPDRLRRAADNGVGERVGGGEEDGEVREMGGMGPKVRGIGAVGGREGEDDMAEYDAGEDGMTTGSSDLKASKG